MSLKLDFLEHIGAPFSATSAVWSGRLQVPSTFQMLYLYIYILYIYIYINIIYIYVAPRHPKYSP